MRKRAEGLNLCLAAMPDEPNFTDEETWGDAQEEATFGDDERTVPVAGPRSRSIPTEMLPRPVDLPADALQPEVVPIAADIHDEAPPRLPTAAMAPLNVVKGKTAARVPSRLASRLRRADAERKSTRQMTLGLIFVLLAAIIVMVVVARAR